MYVHRNQEQRDVSSLSYLCEEKHYINYITANIDLYNMEI